MRLNAISQEGHPKLPSYYDLTTKYKWRNNTQLFETNTAVQCIVDLMAASPCVFQAPSILLGGRELMLVEAEGHNTRFLFN